MKHTYLSLAIGCILMAPHAWAQDAASASAPTSTAASTPDKAPATAKPAAKPGEPTALPTVTVTARRRKEPLQKVPVADSTFSEDQLKDLQAENVDGLQGAVPNLNIVEGRGSANSVNVFIRGIGQPDALQTFDPGVGMYVDDVYYSRIQGALFSLFDIDQIEVLRGPQGTLYGKNSPGGAIKIITRDPFADTTDSVEYTVGDYGREEAKFYAAGKLNNEVAGSIAGAWITNTGDVTDPTTGKHYNNDDTRSVRTKLALKPNEDFTATLSVDYTHQDAAATLGEQTAPLYATDLVLGQILLLNPPTGKYNFTGETSLGPNQGQLLTQDGVTLAIDWNLDHAWLVKSISAFRKLDTSTYEDIDATQLQLGDVFVGLHQKQFSQEVQLQYDNGGPFKAVYGLYYLDETVPSHQEAFANDLLELFTAPVDFLRTIDDNLETHSYAGFGHLTWEFSPTWTAAAGLRYTYETKDYFRTTTAFFGAPLGGFDNTFAFDSSDHWSALTPSFSLQKQFDPNTMGYVSANRGFKSGGFNGRADSADEESTYDPEYVWTYELGLKTQSDDHRLQANAAIFHSDYKNFQARVSEVLDPTSPIPSFAFPVLNAAKLTMNGVEFEGVALLGESTQLSSQVGYLDSKYNEFDDPRVLLDPTLASLHAHVAFAPKWTARLALQHGFPISNGSLFTLGGDASFRSDTWLSVDNRPGLMQTSYTLYGLFGVWDSPQLAWQIRAGVRNLTNVTYKTDAQEFSSVANIQTAYFGWPRDYYLSLRYNF